MSRRSRLLTLPPVSDNVTQVCVQSDKSFPTCRTWRVLIGDLLLDGFLCQVAGIGPAIPFRTVFQVNS